MATNSRALIKLLTGFRRPFMCTVAWYTSHMETLMAKTSEFFCCGRTAPLAAPREVPTKRGTRSGSRHTRSAVSLEPDVLGGNAVVAAAPPNRTAHCHLRITTLPDTHYKSRKTPKEKGYPKKKSICVYSSGCCIYWQMRVWGRLVGCSCSGVGFLFGVGKS